MKPNYNKTEIVSWLEVCLRSENLTEINADIVGYSEKGDGYLSDIVFVYATGKAADGSLKQHSLVLKCSKKSKILRESSPVVQLFINEIYFYDNVISTFAKFQKARNVKNPFNSLPKFYGTFITDDQEVLAFEDLTKRGYGLWDKRQPVTRKHISLVIEQYAKLHSISFAMNDQERATFEKLIEPFQTLFDGFIKGELGNANGITRNFEIAVEEASDMLKNEMDERILFKWKSFGRNIKTDFINTLKNFDGSRAICHGDCWNNNFMFKNEVNTSSPESVLILDWQMARIGSPIADLSHFLFSCASGTDFEAMDAILEEYYRYLSDFLKVLQSDPEIVYPRELFLSEWKKYSKLGIMATPTVLKNCAVEGDQIPDVAAAAESGDFAKAFGFKLNYNVIFKERMKPIIKYAVENDLI